MQQLMASLVFGMSVDDAAYRAGMASARGEARKTEQDFERAGSGMADAIQRSALAVNRAALSMVDSFNNAVAGVKRAGLAMTVGLTIPLGLAGKSAKDTAADFQSAMNRVKAAMLNADPKDIEKLRDAALTLGPAMGRSAIETAGAIESLAKNGMSAARILGGGLEAALKLATVGQTDLSSAADATTDIIQQFHLSASDLPDVVNKVSGALDASKLSFDGYKDAIGQVGGIAGGLGYSFQDMNAALAAVIPLMTGGADAGTSFKTFLLSLVPSSKAAKNEMEKLGISFFDGVGDMKSLAEVAEVLNTKLAGLTAERRQDVLTTIFGTDGMRVALALMQAGAKGVADVKAQIDAASADQKMAVLLEGEAAATQRLASSWEQLKIAVGDAGLIQALTLVKNMTASVVETLASLPAPFYYGIVAMGALAAAAGPIVLGLGAVIGIVAPLIVSMGSLGLATRVLVGVMGALINPVGLAAGMLIRLAGGQVAAAAMGRLGAALIGLTGPIGLVITGAAVLWPMIKALGDVSAATAAAQEKASQAHIQAEDAITKLATSTGKARAEALAHVKALRAEGVEALITARKNVVAARTRYLEAKKNEEDATSVTGIGAAWRGSPLALWLSGRKNAQGAGKEFIAQGQIALGQLADLEKMDAAIAAAANSAATAGGGGSVSGSSNKPAGGAAGAGRDAKADQARYDDELGRLKVDALRAQADFSQGIRSRYTAEMAALAEERSNYARQLANDDALNAAKRQTLLAAKDEELAVRRTIAERDLSDGLAQEEYDIFTARNDAEQEIVRASIDLADSVAAQRAGQLRLLALQREREEADIELVLATKATSSIEWKNANDRQRTLGERYARQEVGTRRQTEGPGDSYLRSLNMSGDAMREAVQAGGVDALRGLNSELLQAGFNAQKLGDAFANTAKRIISSLADIAIQQKIIKPMAEALFGDQKSGSGGFLAGLFKAAGMAANVANGRDITAIDGAAGGPGSVAAMGLIDLPKFGGYRAAGGPIEANKWYRVGENGPEDLFTGRAGTVLPNGALDAAGGRRGTVVQQTINFTGGVDLATRTEVYRVADAARQAAITGIRDADRRRG